MGISLQYHFSCKSILQNYFQDLPLIDNQVQDDIFLCFRYCAEILATLPFTSPDEPLYLIYDINRVIQLRAGAIEANMKMWSCFAQETGSVKIPASNELNEDPTENNVSKQHLASAMKNSSAPTAETLQKFQVIILFIYFFISATQIFPQFHELA